MPKANDTTGVRYLEIRRLSGGVAAYYYCPPAAALQAKIVRREALGRDPVAARKRAADLNATLDAWRKERASAKPRGPAHGTVDWAIAMFKQHEKYLGTSPKTRRDYDRYLELLRTTPVRSGMTLGDMPMAAVRPRHADAIYAHARETRGVRSGAYLVAVARRLWNVVGVRQLELRENPWASMGVATPKPREVVWTFEQLQLFVATAQAQGLGSIGLAAALCFELCQREGDVLRLGWSVLEEAGLVASLRQSKTGRTAYLARTGYLAQLLATTPRRGEVVVAMERTGRPWREDAFRHAFAKVRAAAGLPTELRCQDLRRSGLTELGVAGATRSQMQATSGHASEAMLARIYDRESAEKAVAALKLREDHRAHKAGDSKRARETIPNDTAKPLKKLVGAPGLEPGTR